MEQGALQTATSEAQLGERAGRGDQEAFADLYERHFQGVYDFAARIVGDRDLAGDVVQNTFVKAWERLGEGEVKSVKAWLYTVARNEAIDELRRRRRVVSAGDDEAGPLYAAIDPDRSADPETALADNEMVGLVWSAANGLTREEYSLLDLNLRRGLSADEIADALGLRKGAVYTRLSRLRNALESSVVSTLLMRRGRRACAELNGLLSELGAGDEPTPAVRRAIELHLAGCAVCEESQRRFASPAAIFAGLAPVPALPGVRDAIWHGIAATIGGRAGPTAHGRERADARRSRARRRPRRNALIGLAVLAAAAALGIGAGRLSDNRSASPLLAAHPAPAQRRVIHEQTVRLKLPQSPAITGWSILWTRQKRSIPDRTVDLPGGARAAVSPVFTYGVMYFHFRARRLDGSWTPAQHQGPYRVGGGHRIASP